MVGPARRHHFVPAFLLAGFTALGHENSELWITDKKTRKQFARTPRTTGFENDFHTLESQIVPPDFLETELAKIEGRVAPTIKWILKNRAIPSGRAYNDLMAFIALLMVKTPKARNANQKAVGWLNKVLRKAVELQSS
jgi:hypothetical protein